MTDRSVRCITAPNSLLLWHSLHSERAQHEYNTSTLGLFGTFAARYINGGKADFAAVQY